MNGTAQALMCPSTVVWCTIWPISRRTFPRRPTSARVDGFHPRVSQTPPDARTQDPPDGERSDPRPRIRPEPAPWPLRARHRHGTDVPAGHRIRRTEASNLNPASAVVALASLVIEQRNTPLGRVDVSSLGKAGPDLSALGRREQLGLEDRSRHSRIIEVLGIAGWSSWRALVRGRA